MKIAVTAIQRDEYGLVFPDDTLAWLQSPSVKRPLDEFENPSFSVALTAEKARAIKPYFRLVLMGSVPSVHVYQDDHFYEPTLDDPFKVEVRTLYIPFIVDEVRFVDNRTGAVEKSWKRE